MKDHYINQQFNSISTMNVIGFVAGIFLPILGIILALIARSKANNLVLLTNDKNEDAVLRRINSIKDTSTVVICVSIASGLIWWLLFSMNRPF